MMDLDVDFGDGPLDVDFGDAPAPRKFGLRDYQFGWIKSFGEDRETYSRMLGVGATGTGKTTFFAAASKIEHERGGRTLVLENRDKLVRQTAERIRKETGLSVDVEMAADNASPFADVVVASVQTLCRDARLLGFADNHFTLVIPDESHHALSKSYQKVLNYFYYGASSLEENWESPLDGSFTPKCCVLGVTATPELGTKQSLAEFYQKQCFNYPYISAVNDGWLVPPVMENIPLKINLKGLRTGRTPNGSDLMATDLSERLIPILEALADQIVARASNRKGIVFLPSIECARLLALAITRKGLRGIFVSGECLDVDEKTEAFVAAGKGTFLCNACLYVEGADFPDVDCVVPARATKSVGFYKQQIGRGTRVLPGVVDHLPTAELRRTAIANSAKPNVLILDPLWISDRIDLCDCYDLFTDRPEIKEKMKLDGTAPSQATAEAAERDFIKALEIEAKKHSKKAARVIDPLAWAVSVGDEALVNWEPQNAWDSQPATQGQLDFLLKHHIDVSKIKYKGQAQKYVGRVLTRIKLNLATVHQLSLMKQLGLDEKTCSTLTIKEAGLAIDAAIAHKKEKRSAEQLLNVL
jgi:superfamily II DNA or RNA helicase